MLSNYCIFDIWNNVCEKVVYALFVVNCFQIIVSLTSETTCDFYYQRCFKLWIAFKLLYLWHLKQREDTIYTLTHVVNCFQIIVSLTSETTWWYGTLKLVSLWIAFKLLYLWHLKQLSSNIIKRLVGCELLSNYCIFDIWNNKSKELNKKDIVVNCFQIIVSLTSETTSFVLKFPINRCELLSNYCIFDIWNNIHDFFY